ncbi:MAG: nucleoside hydrolase, partial [Bauldia litoralis]
ALKVVEMSGRTDVPVYARCERPFRRPLVTAEHVHGPTGLDGPDLPEPTVKLQDQHGVDFIVDTLRKEDSGTVTLCTLGPLTNVAMALIKAPDIAPRIREIVMMAGAYFEVGNITPAAEFNVYVDPEAADIVLSAGIPVTIIPLDVTHGVLSFQHRLDAFAGLGNKSGKAVSEMLAFSERFDLEKYGGEGAPLHDPCVIAWVLKPDLFEGRNINVSIETTSELTRGMTVADYWRVTDRPRNALYLRSADDEGFYALLRERLARLP